MCQCLLCDCFWWNFCGVCCAGVHHAYCCISYWCCKPEQLAAIDPHCCTVCKWTGWGGNCLCYGQVCCAPESVKNYSRILSGSMVGGGNVVVITGEKNNNQGPLLG